MPFFDLADAIRRDNGAQQEEGGGQQQEQREEEPASENESSHLLWQILICAVIGGFVAAMDDENGGLEVGRLEEEMVVLRRELVLLREGGGQLERHRQELALPNRAAQFLGRFIVGAVIGAFFAAIHNENGEQNGNGNGNWEGNGYWDGPCRDGNYCRFRSCQSCRNWNTRAADRLRREVGLLREEIEEVRVGAQLLLIEAPQQAGQEQQQQQQEPEVDAADHVLAALTSLIAQTGRTHHSRAAINERVAHLDLLLDHNKIKNTLNRDARFIFDHDLEGWGVVHPAL
ncbi:hypothetical protein A4X13_0g8765 [Tilletia indica]|uniref:Uncharacterized protein n=1 Tax=Tilletia indica TaxID=43049 RepID=A0A177T9P1_9BASI|nr:hypothetical protein A4X13_0g8765 [Tilletia indica]